MQRRFTFGTSRRLHRREDFSAVYEARVRVTSGPILFYGRPNSLSHSRLGLSTSRKVGCAARRNRIRRLLREGFRLLQHELPRGYDLLAVLKPHAPLELSEYQALLKQAAQQLDAKWRRRRDSFPPPPRGG